VIYNRAEEIVHDSVFLHLPDYIPQAETFLKLECFNLGNSIKVKAAKALVDDAEINKNLREKRKVIESSSGNLGLALSVVCSSRNYDFTCVVDKNTLSQNIKAMEAYGTRVVTVTQRDSQGGFLGTRLKFIKDRLAKDPDLVWLNQYENQCNPQIHSSTTASSILAEFPHVDYLFVGAGTCGTLAGCVNAFAAKSPSTKIIAVDSLGSVIFGTPPGRRLIPGIGASVRPPLFSEYHLADKLQVPEIATIRTCNEIAKRYGYLPGGSTGTVLSAIKMYCNKIEPNSTLVAISPDAGERYLETLYCDEWKQTNF